MENEYTIDVKTCDGLTEATAYKTCYGKKMPVGYLQLRAFDGYQRIEFFGVKEADRGVGIGRKLLQTVLKNAEKIIVYPHPESYEDEAEMAVNTLYEIYEKLGFVLEDTNINRDLPGHVMDLV